MAFVTLAEARRQLNYTDETYTADDAEITLYLGAACGAVERHLGQVIETRAFVDYLTVPCTRSTFAVTRTPTSGLTSMVGVDGTIYDVADFDVDPLSGVVTPKFGATPATGRLTVTYQAGQAPTDDQKLAALMILQHLWETQRGGQSGTVGGAPVADDSYDPRFSYAIPRRALELLGEPIPGVA